MLDYKHCKKKTTTKKQKNKQKKNANQCLFRKNPSKVL